MAPINSPIISPLENIQDCLRQSELRCLVFASQKLAKIGLRCLGIPPPQLFPSRDNSHRRHKHSDEQKANEKIFGTMHRISTLTEDRPPKAAVCGVQL
jgi:hypothetical protein